MNTIAKRPPEAFISSKLFEAGIGHVVVSRFKSEGRVESGVFLLDVYCLGVKDAFFTILHVSEHEERLLDRVFRDGRQALSPACARKLVQDAISYARTLGFEPHSDFKQAARVFGGIAADECQTPFTFGKDGKPLYIQGPHDSPVKAERIMKLLHAKCGEGNYHYLAVLGEAPDFDHEEQL
jgi:hypothetical protein